MSKQRRADDGDDELRLTFLEHLEELRQRIIWCLIALAVGSGIGYAVRNQALALILPPSSKLIAITPSEHFFPYLELSLVIGILLSYPFLVYQAWRFVAPGLHRSERRFVLPIILASSCCFYSGVFFAYRVIMPLLLTFLPQFSAGQIEANYAAAGYLHFYLKMVVVFGVCFNTPVVVALLSLMDLATAKTMAKARPYVVVGIFVAAAVLTPPDVVSQLLLGGPLWLLFETGLGIARIIERRRARAAVRERPDDKPDHGDHETDRSDPSTVARGA